MPDEYLVCSGTDEHGSLIVEWSGTNPREARWWLRRNPGWELWIIHEIGGELEKIA